MSGKCLEDVVLRYWCCYFVINLLLQWSSDTVTDPVEQRLNAVYNYC